MLECGIEEASSTLISGPPGTGKSTLAALFASACVQQKHKAAMFVFEASASNLLNRTDALGFDLRSHVGSEMLLLKQIDRAKFSPSEFIHAIKKAADDGAKVIVIDSLNGFVQAMPNEKMRATHIHELLTYFGQRGIVTLMIGVQQGLLGGTTTSTVDASYLADNVILLRYVKAIGEVQQAISIFKNRGCGHGRAIRRMKISADGVHIGPVLRQFRGVLTGVPKTVDTSPQYKADNDHA